MNKRILLLFFVSIYLLGFFMEVTRCAHANSRTLMASHDVVCREGTSDSSHIVTSSKEKESDEYVILFQDFDDETTGAVPENWTVENLQCGSFLVDELAYYGDEGKSGRLTDNSTVCSPSPYKNFPEQIRTIVVSFALRLAAESETSLNLSICIDDGDFSGANICFSDEGQIMYYAGRRFTSLRSYAANSWYRIKMIINVPNNTYDIFIDDYKEARGVPFTNTALDIRRIIFAPMGSGKPKANIDNISIRYDLRVPEDYPTIQEAVDVASPGNVILVASSDRPYYECVRFRNKHELKLIGEGRTTTVIDGKHRVDQNVVLIDADSNSITIQNFTIRNAHGEGTCGIRVEGNENRVQGNLIRDNEIGIGCGENTQNNVVFHNFFICNRRQASDSGANTWNSNYWSDYTGFDEDQDGYGDTPYKVDNGHDSSPLFLIQDITQSPPQNKTSYDKTVTVEALTLEFVKVVEGKLNVTYNLKPYGEIKMKISDNKLTAEIPAFPYGTEVQYYINASNVCGIWIQSSIHSYTVGDRVPPEIEVDLEPQEPFENQDVNVSAEVSEHVNASGIRNVLLRYRVNKGPWWCGDMILEGSEVVGNDNVTYWELTIPRQAAKANVTFRIEGLDKAGLSGIENDSYTVLSLALLHTTNPTTGEETDFLNFTIMSEGARACKSFNVTNLGGGLLNWSIPEPTKAWIESVTPDSGADLEQNGTDLVEVCIDTTGLSTGLHVGSLNVTWKGEFNVAGYKIVYVHVTVRTIIIDESEASSSRCDVCSKQTIGFHLIWSHNWEPVQNGTVAVNENIMVPVIDGWANFTAHQSKVITICYDVTGIDCDGITSFTLKAPTPSITWDRVKIRLQTQDDRIDVCTSAIVNHNAIYESDGTSFIGSIKLNNTIMHYNTTGRRYYAVNSISDPHHNITEFTSNTVCCIWDRIEVIGEGVVPGQIGSVEIVKVWFIVVYEYDGVLFDDTKGSLWVNVSSLDYWYEREMACVNYRWEYVFPARDGRIFAVSRICDDEYDLTVIHDIVGPVQTLPNPDSRTRFHEDIAVTSVFLSTASPTTKSNWIGLAVFLNIIIGVTGAPLVTGLYCRSRKHHSNLLTKR